MQNLSLTSRIASLYEIHAALLEPKFKALGIRWSTFQLLSAVHASGGQASQAEIARRLGVAPATLSESVAVHVNRKLLEQVGSSDDRRIKLLKLSADAEKLLESVFSEVEEIEKMMLSGVSNENARTVANLLDQLTRNLVKGLS